MNKALGNVQNLRDEDHWQREHGLDLLFLGKLLELGVNGRVELFTISYRAVPHPSRGVTPQCGQNGHVLLRFPLPRQGKSVSGAFAGL